MPKRHYTTWKPGVRDYTGGTFGWKRIFNQFLNLIPLVNIKLRSAFFFCFLQQCQCSRLLTGYNWTKCNEPNASWSLGLWLLSTFIGADEFQLVLWPLMNLEIYRGLNTSFPVAGSNTSDSLESGRRWFSCFGFAITFPVAGLNTSDSPKSCRRWFCCGLTTSFPVAGSNISESPGSVACRLFCCGSFACISFPVAGSYTNLDAILKLYDPVNWSKIMRSFLQLTWSTPLRRYCTAH